jgi:hypothetical protein
MARRSSTSAAVPSGRDRVRGFKRVQRGDTTIEATSDDHRPMTLLFPELIPANRFHTGNGSDGKHYWLTPPDLYAELDAEFHFDFDPCPYPLPAGFDGLTCEWGQSNYVNPPFGSIIHQGRKKGPTAWARKAIAEHRKGKTVVFVYPMHKWRLMLLEEMGSGVRNLGDVRWLATEDGSVGPGIGEHIACFVLRP